MISKSRFPIVTASNVVKVPKNFLVLRSLQLSLALLVLSLSIYGAVVMITPIAGVFLTLIAVSSWNPRSTVATANRSCSRSAQSSLHPIRLSLLTEIFRGFITTGSFFRWKHLCFSSGCSRSLFWRFQLAVLSTSSWEDRLGAIAAMIPASLLTRL